MVFCVSSKAIKRCDYKREIMENITKTLKRGYSIAKTKEQFDRVKYWQDKISKKVASCHSMLDECDRLDHEFDKVAKRMGLK